MKKILSILVLSLFIGQQTLAFTAATLYKGQSRIAATSAAHAKSLFSKGYKLETKLGSVVSTGYKSKLTASITSGGTTISVSSVNDINGTPLPCSASNKCYFNIEPGNQRQEPVTCTGVSGNSFIGCTRGLVATGQSESGSSTLAFAHNAGSSIILTNIAQFYNGLVDVNNNQTIAGNKTFTGTTSLNVGTISMTPTNGTDITNKTYVDGVSIAGAPNANQTTKGISKLSSNPASSTNPISLNSEEVSTTSGASKVVRASTTGLIDPAWYQGNISTFTSTTTFTGATYGAGFTHVQYITATGSSIWTRPVGITRIKVRVIGAGGDGGGSATLSASTGCSGGSGGGYSEKIIDVSATSSVSVFVADHISSTTGQVTTSFGTFASSTSGVMGACSPNSSTVFFTSIVGQGFGGDVNTIGSAGGVWFRNGSLNWGGSGGGNTFGSAGVLGNATGVTGFSGGNNAVGYGTGGSGGSNDNASPQSAIGGFGKQGIIVIEY